MTTCWCSILEENVAVFEGDPVGKEVGPDEGIELGGALGIIEGRLEGGCVGVRDGAVLVEGEEDGDVEVVNDGPTVGLTEGAVLRLSEGASDAATVGLALGASKAQRLWGETDRQNNVLQSLFVWHFLHGPHAGQMGPPQSVSVSSSLLNPFVHPNPVGEKEGDMLGVTDGWELAAVGVAEGEWEGETLVMGDGWELGGAIGTDEGAVDGMAMHKLVSMSQISD